MTEHIIAHNLLGLAHLARGDKHFLVMPETMPPVHYGDVLVFTHPSLRQPLVRWVTCVESGGGIEPDWIVVELAP